MTTVTHTTQTLHAATIVDLPPSDSPRVHDELEVGLEQMYVGLSGTGGVVLDEPEPRTALLGRGQVVVVPASVGRTLTSGPNGLRVLVVSEPQTG